MQHLRQWQVTAEMAIPTLPPHMSDNLGKLASDAVHQLCKSPSFKDFVQAFQDPSDPQPMVSNLPHPVVGHLDQCQWHGVPFCTIAPHWTTEQKAQAVKQGTHKLAINCAEFVCKEFVNMVHKQFLAVPPVESVLHLKEL